MKRAILLAIMALLTATTVGAQERTLFDNGSFEWDGFGGPMVAYTRFNGSDGLLVGGQGAVLINHLVYLGGGGYGLANRVGAPSAMIDGQLRTMRYDLGYGGGMIGVIIKNNHLLHAAAEVMIGGGGITWTQRDMENDGHMSGDKSDGFFVVQPAAHLELNVTRWMRVDAGAGYRFVTGVTLNDLDNSDVGGPVAGLTFRFGTF
jgi:hypothetical protein